MSHHLVILGSTGSIGRQTLEVVSAFPDQFQVLGLSAHSNHELLKTQILETRPRFVAVSKDVAQWQHWLKLYAPHTRLLEGPQGLSALAALPEADTIVVAISGTAGLAPTYAAVKAGKRIALACKEVLVAAGNLIMPLVKHHQATLLPIDSEHAALKQCLAAVQEDLKQVSKLVLTASGGPFLGLPKADFFSITPEQALKHPKWDMGAKITIDSATLMNKGLEVIEAHHLFGVPYDQLDVMIHPQSIVHSLVEFSDGTWLAQMGKPDMRFPIQYALTYPQKHRNTWPKMTVSDLASLTFQAPDTDRFPMLKLAIQAGKRGGTAPAIMNAANEAAVHLFLQHKIGFLDLYKVVEQTLSHETIDELPTFDQLLTLDMEIKRKVLHNGA